MSMGTVFPFVYLDPEDYPGMEELVEYINTEFAVTAQLFEIPPIDVDPFEALQNATPIRTVIAEKYTEMCWKADIPKNPGMIGRTNNPGIPIHWEDIFVDPDTVTDNTKLKDFELPSEPIGVFAFDGVAPGNYLLVLSRAGYVTRYAEIEITSRGDYLGHRELVLGDVDSDGEVTYMDIIKVIANYSSLFDPGADPPHDARYDVNNDFEVDYADAVSVSGMSAFWFYTYSDTRIWINKYFSGK